MSIRLLARDLYRLQREVTLLEKALSSAPIEAQTKIKDQLRKKIAQRDQMRTALDGQLER